MKRKMIKVQKSQKLKRFGEIVKIEKRYVFLALEICHFLILKRGIIQDVSQLMIQTKFLIIWLIGIPKPKPGIKRFLMLGHFPY